MRASCRIHAISILISYDAQVLRGFLSRGKYFNALIGNLVSPPPVMTTWNPFTRENAVRRCFALAREGNCSPVIGVSLYASGKELTRRSRYSIRGGSQPARARQVDNEAVED